MTRNRWRAAFLTITALAVVMEIVAGVDGNPDTDPWTDLIVAYVPMEVTVALVGALVLWLPIHLWRAYVRKRRAGRRTDMRE